MISKHSAHSTSLPTNIDIHTHTYVHTYIHIKGNTVLLYIYIYIHTYVRTCVRACVRACVHACMHACIHAYIHTYMFVVNFDALAQASDFRIERRQVVFLCWEQDSNPGGLWNPIFSRLNACWQTDWAIEDQAKTWTRQPVPMISKHSAHLTPLPYGVHTWLWRYTYLLLLISMLWHRQVIFESKRDKLSSSSESRIRTQGVSETQSSADWMPADKPTELSRTKLKTWTRQPVPMISEHSANLAPLSVDFRSWLWRYTYLLLLILMLWHRQAIFKSKGDKLSSSVEGRIWTRDPRHLIASRLWSASIQPTRPHCQLAFAPGSGDIHICC